MKIRTITISFLIAISTLLWTGCGKVGPEGPQGPQGPASSDIISSIWYTPGANDWTYDNTVKEWYYDVSNAVTTAEITKDIVENGVVLAYMSSSADHPANSVRPLPSYAMGCDWNFLIHTYGSIEFTSNALTNPGSIEVSFRFILIPASVYLKSTKVKSKSVVELKNMPYQDVCKMFGIQE